MNEKNRLGLGAQEPMLEAKLGDWTFAATKEKAYVGCLLTNADRQAFLDRGIRVRFCPQTETDYVPAEIFLFLTGQKDVYDLAMVPLKAMQACDGDVELAGLWLSKHGKDRE